LVNAAPGPGTRPSWRVRRRARRAEAAAKGACRNCGASLHGRYCHDCRHDSLPPARRLRDLGEDLLDNVFSFSAAVPRTLRALIVNPSEVPDAHRTGDRSRYLSPIKLYVTASLVFFLFLGIANVTMFQLQVVRTGDPWVRTTDDAFEGGGFHINLLWMHRRLHEPPDPLIIAAFEKAAVQQENATEWDRSLMRFVAATVEDPSDINDIISTWMPRTLWLLMPLYALLLWPLYPRRLLIEHVILALWAHSVMFLLLVLGAVWNFIGVGYGLVLAIVLYQLCFTIGLKGYYGSRWWGAAVKGVVHSTAYIGLLWIPLVITFLFWQSAQYVPPEWWSED
jgi:hypothetical protein